ncbi:MAG: T9SS type A sorting domain-containing protein [Candidatus Cloacimonetes bacterium]|nr:T9SS type A sorting domain-containing protein [Candidatus Cloacimonadota bacterium]
MLKKMSVLISFILFTSCLFAQELQQTTRGFIPVSGLDRGTIILPYTEATQSNWVDYEFVVEPTTIMTSYYDYMPGGYANYPIQKQIGNGNGTCLTFHATDAPSSMRRQYWAYFDEDGNPQGCSPISTYNEWQGYGDLVLHPATGKCITTWHENEGCALCYDDFSPQYTPGAWSSVTIIPNPLPDEYLWPRLYTGPSPQGDDWIRIYHISQNGNPNTNGFACNDVRIMYMDIENTASADLSQILNLDNWTTITPMYTWRDKSCRVQSLCFAADDDYYNTGKVGMMGYCEWLEGDLGNMPVNPGIFFWESTDYGATWDPANLHCHSQGASTALYQVVNKPQFEFNGVVPDYLDVDVLGFHNTAQYPYHYDDSYFSMTYLQSYTYTDPETKNVYYLQYFTPQAEVIWDRCKSEFEFQEVPMLAGHDSYSGRSVPWKIVQNDTILYIVVAQPTDYGDTQKSAISANPRIQVWSDATYQTMAQLGYSQYDEYHEHPILNIAFSYWQTYRWLPEWYYMIELTKFNNYHFDFSNQRTIFPNINYYMQSFAYHKDFWSDWIKIYLYYYDDNSYGSYILGQGENTGGDLKYCEIQFRVLFNDVDIVHSNISATSNTPNPFSEGTQIRFSSRQPIRNSSVTIYNAKGQYVTTLESQNGTNPTEGYATWNGKDLHGNSVANGIYFYKVTSTEVSHIGKMLLAR